MKYLLYRYETCVSVTSEFPSSVSDTMIVVLMLFFIHFRTVLGLLILWKMRMLSCKVLFNQGNVSNKYVT